MENNWLNLMNLLKKYFNINRDIYLEKIINPDNLIYKYKTEGRSPKDFSVYQNLIVFYSKI